MRPMREGLPIYSVEHQISRSFHEDLNAFGDCVSNIAD
uniref:Uncharacterized protein n=1 Tax=Rhizophora mucronata TaxID=61149 RepID=A0A2P2MF97_RHIMU